MKQKILTLILTLFACVAAGAHDFEVDGIYYNITSSTDLTVCVTYRGYSSTSYSDEYIGNVVIPATVEYNGQTYSVTSIGESAFYNCKGLTSVEISNSVTEIGDYAFAICSNLSNIDIPKSVTKIGKSAFNACKRFTNITIPSGVTKIENHLFSSCTSLTSVDIPSSVTEIGSYAFSFCNFTSFSIPSSVTRIGDCAFLYCVSLTSITIPESVTTIGSEVFSGCSKLYSVVIPSSVTNLGNTFLHCNDLKSVIFKSTTPPKVGEFAFMDSEEIIDESLYHIRYWILPDLKIYVPYTAVDAYKQAWNVEILLYKEILFADPDSTPSTPTAIDNIKLNNTQKAVKTVENGKIVITKGGVKYDVSGRVIGL